MKQVIGFTNKYYTLWKVSDPYIYWKSDESTVERIDYIYIKNLSMDFDSAKSKMDGEYDIDLGLRGAGSFSKTFKDTANADEFSYGKLHGKKINEATDAWQLKRAMDSEDTKERRSLAYKRLLELDVDVVEYKDSYMTREDCDKFIFELKNTKSMLKSNYVGDVNDSYEGDVLVTETFSFDSYYGKSYCFKMIDKNNNLLVAFTKSKYFVGYWVDEKENKDGTYEEEHFVDGVTVGDKIKISGIIKKHDERDEQIRIENKKYCHAKIKQTQLTNIKKQGE